MEHRWEILLVREVAEWFDNLTVSDPGTADLVEDALDLLADVGPSLGRPLVDHVKGSRHHNMKELRPGSTGASGVRILLAFDPVRRAVLLVAGDKSNGWGQRYRRNVQLADERYDTHLAEMETREYR